MTKGPRPDSRSMFGDRFDIGKDQCVAHLDVFDLVYARLAGRVWS